MKALRRIGLSLSVAAALALLAIVTPAIAQSPQTGTRLEPGVNLVGWVGEATPVSQLFREIPRLEAVWAWDAELRDWVVAGRGASDWLGGLGTVSAGMGLRLQLGGGGSFVWRRSTEPTRGLVRLWTGWNLVAWSGADGATIDDIRKGIGASLVSVRRWDATNQRYSSVVSDVRRGEVLWVRVSRTVNWLQPTGIMPRLVFPGGASADVREGAERLIPAFLAFFRETFGLEADGSAYEIWMPTSGEALRQTALERGVEAERAEGLISQWNSVAGWLDNNLVPGKQATVLGQPNQEEIEEIQWMALLAHEYFHLVHSQLTGDNVWPPIWMYEGAAEWATDVYLVSRGEADWDERHVEVRSLAVGGPPLAESVHGNTGFLPYQLGWLAMSRLSERAGSDAWIEFWRRTTPTASGPHGRWTAKLDWEDVFEDVFGISTADFYTDFDAWIGPAAIENSEGSPGHIRGRVLGPSGAPAARLSVRAIRVEYGADTEWPTPTVTDAAGRFSLTTASEGMYRLSLDVNDDCRRHYAGDGVAELYTDATLVSAAAGASDVVIRLPADACGWGIRGRVVDSDGEPLAGVTVSACEAATYRCSEDERSALDGSFALAAPVPGEYRVRFELVNGCAVYYGARGATPYTRDATPIRITGAGVSGVTMRVPQDVCAWRITGRITRADGQPFSERYVSACRAVDGDCVATAPIRSDGSFAVAAPVEDTYRLSFALDTCEMYFRDDSFTTDPGEASSVRVAGGDVRLRPNRIPTGMCAYRILGRVIDVNGSPVAYRSLTLCRADSCSGAQTTADGSFAVRAPGEGSYTFEVWLADDCNHAFSGQALGSSRNPVRVSGADAAGVTLRLPGTVEQLCR